jgi:hypothetical protein
MQSEIDYISVGGNRQPAAADWRGSRLAFGAGNSIALWNPNVGLKWTEYSLLISGRRIRSFEG